MSLGKTIRAARHRQNLTLIELAERVDISVSHLSRIESNHRKHPASEPVIQKIAHALGLDSDHLCVLGGRLPADVARYLVKNPRAIYSIRERMARVGGA